MKGFKKKAKGPKGPPPPAPMPIRMKSLAPLTSWNNVVPQPDTTIKLTRTLTQSIVINHIHLDQYPKNKVQLVEAVKCIACEADLSQEEFVSIAYTNTRPEPLCHNCAQSLVDMGVSFKKYN